MIVWIELGRFAQRFQAFRHPALLQWLDLVLAAFNETSNRSQQVGPVFQEYFYIIQLISELIYYLPRQQVHSVSFAYGNGFVSQFVSFVDVLQVFEANFRCNQTRQWIFRQ